MTTPEIVAVLSAIVAAAASTATLLTSRANRALLTAQKEKTEVEREKLAVETYSALYADTAKNADRLRVDLERCEERRGKSNTECGELRQRLEEAIRQRDEFATQVKKLTAAP